MTLDADIEQIARQEAELVFPRFTEDEAWELGLALRAEAQARDVSVAIDIRSPGRILFHCAMPGTAPDNAEWIRRKSNLVFRVLRSSYGYGRLMEKRGIAIGPDRGLDPLEYTSAGGCFPIRVANAGVVAVATISGLPQREDHQLVVAGICRHLGIDPAGLLLD